MKRLRICALFAGAVLFVRLPAEAHHSNVTFYFMDQTVEVTGVVKELKLINPHVNLQLEVTDANGRTVTWSVDGPNAGGMRAAGWSPASVAPGEVVTVVGSPARNPDFPGMYMQRVIKADGSVLETSGGRAPR